MPDKLKKTNRMPRRTAPPAAGTGPERKGRRADGNALAGVRGPGGMSPFSNVVLFLVIAVCLWINFNETSYSPGGLMWARGILEHSVVILAGYLLGSSSRGPDKQ
ncbi:MAG TPA: hypothetical protein VF586_00720 [Pyrinomonadaceae bacterium]|jgi:hypothetical protein